MNAQAIQAKTNLMTRAHGSILEAAEFAQVLKSELAKIKARKAPVQAAALERHEASIAGYEAAIDELTAPAVVEQAEQAEEAPAAAGTLVAIFTAEGFAGVVPADADIEAMAAEAGIKVAKTVEGCALCTSLGDVPNGCTIIYRAEWDEVIEDGAGQAGKIVYA